MYTALLGTKHNTDTIALHLNYSILVAFTPAEDHIRIFIYMNALFISTTKSVSIYIFVYFIVWPESSPKSPQVFNIRKIQQYNEKKNRATCIIRPQLPSLEG